MDLLILKGFIAKGGKVTEINTRYFKTREEAGLPIYDSEKAKISSSYLEVLKNSIKVVGL